MVYSLILQNNLTANIIDIKKLTLRVNNRMQGSILETQISLHKQKNTTAL